MNTIVKLSVAGALAMGYSAAHADFAVPDSYQPGDVLLFAEVMNSSGTIVGSYAGDTGIKIGTAFGGGLTTGTIYSGDTSLTSLISLGQQTGNKVLWSVQGGGGVAGDPNYYDLGAAQFVTTTSINPPTQLIGRTGGNITNWGLANALRVIQTNAGTGNNNVFAASTSAGGVWDTTDLINNFSNWYQNGTATAVTGLGTSSQLYSVTAGGTGTVGDPIALATLGFVSLTANGLTFAASGGGGGGTPVPLPAAVWLLGSGLLGLFGIGRRKQPVAA